jgi:hypothetical protein
LPIIRDLMIRGFRAFKVFQESGEGIATSLLADRLQKFEAAGVIAMLISQIRWLSIQSKEKKT